MKHTTHVYAARLPNPAPLLDIAEERPLPAEHAPEAGAVGERESPRMILEQHQAGR